MPKNALTELNEIFVKSQRLTAQQTDAGSTSRHLNRGVSELGEATRSLASRAENVGYGMPTDDPHSRKIFNEVNAITLSTVQDSVGLEGTDLEGYLAHHHDMIILTAIEESRQIGDNYLYETQQKAVMNEWESARSTFMESLGHRAHKWTPGFTRNAHPAEDPQQPLLDYVPNKGNASFESSFIGSPYFNKLNATPAKKSGSVAAEVLDALPGNANPLSDRPPLPKIISSHADCIRKISQNQSNPLTSRNENIHPCKLLLSALKDLGNEYSRNAISSSSSSSSSSILSMKDMIGYRSILSLIASMTGEDRFGTNVTPGYFSTICYDPAVIDTIQLKEKKNKLTKGGKAFFEEQQMLFWEKKVDDYIHKNEIDLSSRVQGRTIQMKLQKLIQYEYRMNIIPKQCKLVDIPLYHGANATNPSMAGINPPTLGLASVSTAGNNPSSYLKSIPIWALIYYYLRSGNIEFAIQELHDLHLSSHSEEMLHILSILKVINGESNDIRELKSPKGSNTPGGFGSSGLSTPRPSSSVITSAGSSSSNNNNVDFDALENAIKQCKFYYQRETMKDENSIDPYFIFILNLIGLIDNRDLNGSLIPNFAFEDFLWSHLWFITVSRQFNDLLLTRNSNSNNNSSSTPLLARSPFNRKPAAIAVETTSEENELLELVYAYGGANYFDHDGLSPYKYALLLCCCHRFGDALTYLWMTNKVFPAIHLMILCLYYGLILPHVPLLNNPSHPLVTSDYHHYHHTHPSSSSSSSSSSALVANGNVLSLTPSLMISYFLQNQYFQYYPEYSLDYYFTLNTKWNEHISLMNEETLKIQMMKYEELLLENLTKFCISLHFDQLYLILGKPTTNTIDSLLKKEYRSNGYLDSYWKNDKISLLINKIIYYYLTIEKDVMKVLDYYYYCIGNYQEIISHYSSELLKYWILDNSVDITSTRSASGGLGASGRKPNTNTTTTANIYSLNLDDLEQQRLLLSSQVINQFLLQKRKQRDFWRNKAENFMKFILETSKSLDARGGNQNNNSTNNLWTPSSSSFRNHNNINTNVNNSAPGNNVLLLFNISTEAYNNFYLLMTLYQFHDEIYLSENPIEALALLEKGRIFPGLQAETMDGMFFFLNPVLKYLLDDLILLAIRCLIAFFRENPSPSSSSASSHQQHQQQQKRAEWERMHGRYEALTAFLGKFKEQLSKKTVILQEAQKLQSILMVR